jgi:putative ABC transport system permease protein
MGGVASMMGFGGSTYWQEMTDNDEFILSIYDLIGDGSRLPTSKNEVVLVVDEYNRIDAAFFEKLGIYTDADSYQLTDFIGKTILKVIPNDSYYTQTSDGIFVAASPAEYNSLYNGDESIELTITGILRVKESASSAGSYLYSGLVYTTALTDYIVENAQNSQIAIAQKNSNMDVIANTPFANSTVKEMRLLALGADTTPTGISIYPTSFEAKEEIKTYLDAYNEGKAEENQVTYSDMAETMSSMTNTMMSTVSLVLIAFSAISLLVSTIMIAIIIYVSVIERTKEIGILRSVGARKKDISMVFIMESLLIGLVAGVLGVGLAYLLTIPVNWLISSIVGISGVANLTAIYAVLLVGGSMILTLIAGFFPSRSAAKKDPVVALRTE